jgi:L-ascorbate metabolism protein UlaG (beta-lactamase superfamily)
MNVGGQFEQDVIQTSIGDLEITFLGHGTLLLKLQDKIIHIDPFSNVANYSKLPQADLILLTHEHRDHLDPDALALIQSDHTQLVCSASCMDQVEGGMVMHNGDQKTIFGWTIEAVPAYNIVHKRDTGDPFHPQGVGNGYILTFGDTRIYVAGDTENVPEMADIRDIDIAFLPMNLPYTMTPEMVADAAKTLQPAILYPYHYGNTDTRQIIDLLRDVEEIEVRIRKMA